jgi:hypothetical protein
MQCIFIGAIHQGFAGWLQYKVGLNPTQRRQTLALYTAIEHHFAPRDG